MTITLDLEPEIEEGLRTQAQARGVSLSDYVKEIVEREAHAAEPAEVPRAKNLVELFAPIRGLFGDGELDFSRSPSTARPVDFS